MSQAQMGAGVRDSSAQGRLVTVVTAVLPAAVERLSSWAKHGPLLASVQRVVLPWPGRLAPAL